MPNEIYHRSNFGNPNAEGFGDVYYDHAATNKLYNHSDYYENSDGTDATLKDLNNKASIVLTPTAYSDGSLNTVIPPYQVLPTELVTNGDFSNGTTNWTPNANATLSIDSGRLKVAISGGSGYPSQNITTEIGKKYKITADAFIGTATKVSLYSAAFGFNDLTADGSYNLIFTATSTSTQIRLYVYGDGTFGFWDNISIKEIQEADFDFSRGSSATRVNEQGLVEDSQGDDYPRINFTDGTGSLLLEPQRTNSFVYSEDYSQSNWTKSHITATADSIVSPDGSLNASLITISNSTPYLGQSQTLTSGTTYTMSAFVKKGTNRWVRLGYVASGTNAAWFDLENNVVGTQSTNSISASIENYGNGWYRITNTFSSHISSGIAFFGLSGADNSIDATGVIGNTVYIWGLQVTQGDYPTSYIPTESASVTRSADVANNSGNADLFNDSEGVLYAEIAALNDDGTARRMSISDGTTANRVVLMYHQTSNVIRGFVSSGGSLVSDMTYTVSDTTQFNKIAFSYKQDDFKLWIDGVQRTTDDSGTTPTGINELKFEDANGLYDFYGKTKCVAVFKEALSNDLLERLTGEGYESFRLLAEANNYTII